MKRRIISLTAGALSVIVLLLSCSRIIMGMPEEVSKVVNQTIPGPAGEIPVRIYTPQGNGPFPMLVYAHGGGWVFGNLNSHDYLCRALTNRVGCIVISVDYRLAPKHKFPAAPEDVYAAAKWVFGNADLLNGDVRHIAVGGTSAGANLAAAVCLMARDRGVPPLVFQLLAFPPTNLASLDTNSYHEFARGYGLSKVHVEWFRKRYFKGKQDWKNPYASPLLAEDLRNLPPALVLTGEYDILRDEGEAYAKRLQQAGVQARYIRYAGQGHAGRDWISASEKARGALAEVASVLRSVFAQ